MKFCEDPPPAWYGSKFPLNDLDGCRDIIKFTDSHKA